MINRKKKQKREIIEGEEEYSSGYFNESTMDFSDRYKVREDFIFTRKTDTIILDSLLHFGVMVSNEAKDALFVRNLDSSNRLRIRNLAASRRFVGLVRFQIRLLKDLCKVVIQVREGQTIKDAPLKNLMEYLLETQGKGYSPITRMGRSAVRVKFEKSMLRKYDEYFQEYLYYLENQRDETV